MKANVLNTDLNGKVAVVTGAGGVLCSNFAAVLARAGAKVALLDINEETLSLAKAKCELHGTKVLTYVCDISKEEEVNAVVSDATKKLGKIDILVNNAALWRGAESFLDTSIEKWKLFIDINIMGMVYVTRAVLPKMIENKLCFIRNKSKTSCYVFTIPQSIA